MSNQRTKRNLIPLGNTIICKKINDKEKEQPSEIFKFKHEKIPEYQVVSMHYLSDEVQSKYNFKQGDVVVVSSTGTPVLIDEEKYYLFKPEHIVGKI